MDNVVILVSLIILLGGFTQGLTGFGLALVSVPLLSLVVDAKLAIPVAGIFGWLVTFPVVWKMRQHIQFKTALIVVAGSVPASFIGARLLAVLPSTYILIAMGITLVLSSIQSLRNSKALLNKASTPVSLGAGFTSGVLGASVGEPGPPVIAYTSMMPWTSDQTKSTLVFIFMLQMIGAIAGFWSHGLITEDVTGLVVKAMPAFIIGTSMGMLGYYLLHKFKIDYHKIVHSMLFAIGILLIVKNI
ncbi:sulfite exporter TauE/SafE family protein [Vibrio sp. SS-MA-C1-2]|uniref:sulfite exporter TauE/SafE family protein n=1 Tax=Vibrio sp. SS-MA-C1-2 TaxID=2908646 RepID=UPI001F19F048|nr:sulfite exporter TauE/SafE family protein [Vibrio sp. SS-MA-C1-2]UJF18247.1 sulfite exporter TauE/SafE family protein [Vibrio sp. SS-MA-C1-2]